MKRIILIGVLSILIVLSNNCMAKKKEKKKKEESSTIELKTKLDTINYIIGTDIGKNLKMSFIKVNSKVLVQGIDDATNGADTLFSASEIQNIMMAFQKEIQLKKAEGDKIAVEINKKEGEVFLAEKKSTGTVTELPKCLYKAESDIFGSL